MIINIEISINEQEKDIYTKEEYIKLLNKVKKKLFKMFNIENNNEKIKHSKLDKIKIISDITFKILEKNKNITKMSLNNKVREETIKLKLVKDLKFIAYNTNRLINSGYIIVNYGEGNTQYLNLKSLS